MTVSTAITTPMPFPTSIPKPLPHDFLLLLISHFDTLSDTPMLLILAHLDKDTNNRVNRKLYKIVRLDSPLKLTAFFGYFTADGIRESRKTSEDMTGGEESTGQAGKRQSQLIGLVRHLEVKLYDGDLRGEWWEMVTKLHSSKWTDRGFLDGILDSLETLYITNFDETCLETDSLVNSPAECGIGYAVAYILAKCRAKHVRYEDWAWNDFVPGHGPGCCRIAQIGAARLSTGTISLNIAPCWRDFPVWGDAPSTPFAIVEEEDDEAWVQLDDYLIYRNNNSASPTMPHSSILLVIRS
jgi:hypothetical protein